MTEVIGIIRKRIKLNSGKVIKPIDRGWYDGRQYYKGKLGNIGEIYPNRK